MSWQCCVSLCVCIDERYVFACSGICVLRMSTLWLCFYTHTEHAHIIPIMKCIKQWVHAPVRTSWLHSSSLALTSPPPFMLLLVPATCQHLPTIIWSSPLRSTTCLLPFLFHHTFSTNLCPPTFVTPFPHLVPCPPIPPLVLSSPYFTWPAICLSLLGAGWWGRGKSWGMIAGKNKVRGNWGGGSWNGWESLRRRKM